MTLSIAPSEEVHGPLGALGERCASGCEWCRMSDGAERCVAWSAVRVHSRLCSCPGRRISVDVCVSGGDGWVEGQKAAWPARVCPRGGYAEGCARGV